MIPLAAGLFSYFAGLRQHRAVTFLVLLFAIFLGLSVMAHTTRLLNFDERITRTFQRLRSNRLDRLVRFITVFADPVALIAFGILASVVLFVSGQRWAALITAISILGLPLNYGIKQIIRRPRPDAALVKVLLPVVGRSFPSGHAMTAMMFYGLLAFLCWVNLNNAGWRLFWSALMSFLAIGVGVTRVYLGVHWFSDVLGGWTAGLFFLIVLALLYRAVAGVGEVAV